MAMRALLPLIRVVAKYTLLVFSLCFFAGAIVGGIQRILFPTATDPPWGGINAYSVVKFGITLLITSGAFWRLARRHQGVYLLTAPAVALLTAVTELVILGCDAQENASISLITGVGILAINFGCMIAGGFVGGAFKPSAG